MATSRRAYRGLGSGTDCTSACCTDVVAQWLARDTGRGRGIKAHGIRRRRILFTAPQVLCRLKEVINIVPHIDIRRRAGVVELMAVSRLSRRPSSTAALSARGPSSTSASEELESSSSSSIIGSSTLCQKDWSSISTIKGSARAYLGFRLSCRFVLTRYVQ